ncbi:MAG: DinB family protein [Candidatus Hydrogenedentota bacterium]
MTTKQAVDLTRFIRGLMLGQLEGLSDDHWTATPAGLSNNILWNVGHIAFYQSAFLLKHFGQPSPVPDSFKYAFKAGSKPAEWTETPDAAAVLAALKALPDAIAAADAAGAYASCNPFKIGDRITMTDPMEIFMFHAMHEGVHNGRIIAIKKLLA